MSAAQTLRPGRYRHFKGKEYELLFVATHSETLEPMVVYRALYGERGVWVRPAAMWDEMIERDGQDRPPLHVYWRMIFPMSSRVLVARVK
ncbi:MAG: DUF1653 domain-containing protein [Oscillospiraceae bacterium]